MHSNTMNHAPRVSVVVPVYNIEAYLGRCLDSLLQQSFRDFEVLCVDDASSDDSAEVVRQYQRRDPRIRLLTQDHAGVSAARNLGIRESRGEYLLFFDGDDWAGPDMLRCMVTAAEESGADVTVCSACIHCENGGEPPEALKRRLTVSDGFREAGEGPEGPWTLLEMPGCWPFVWNKLIRADLIRQWEILFSRQLQLGEDGLFLQILFQYVRTVKFVHQQLYHYRYLRKSSATVRLSAARETRFLQHLQILQVLCRELESRGLPAGSSPELQRWAVGFLYNDFVKLSSLQQQEASDRIRPLLGGACLPGHGLADRITANRLNILCSVRTPPANIRRVARMLYTKAENRIYSKLVHKP